MLQFHAVAFSKCSTLFPHDYDKVFSIGKMVRNTMKENIHQSRKTHQTFIISTLCLSFSVASHQLCGTHSAGNRRSTKNRDVAWSLLLLKYLWDYVSCLKGLVLNFIFPFLLLQSSWLMVYTNGMYNKFKTLLFYTHMNTWSCLFYSSVCVRGGHCCSIMVFKMICTLLGAGTVSLERTRCVVWAAAEAPTTAKGER